MKSVNWIYRFGILAVCVTASICTFLPLSYAHDFSSGRSMGLPPNLRAVQAELDKFVPANASIEAAGRMRGIVRLSVRWPQNMTVRVCFLSGSRDVRRRVARVAEEWNRYVNLKLDFGNHEDPRRCERSSFSHIKVGFVTTGQDAGYWSYVGTRSMSFAHSLNLGDLGDDSYRDSSKFRGVILHEFGHALGLLHEHQSPKANCDAELDSEKVKKWAVRMGWDDQDITTNIRSYLASNDIRATPHDRKSIMHYSMPPELFKRGKDSVCWVPKNNELSEMDKDFAGAIYPKAIAGLGQVRSIRRSSARSSQATAASIEASFQAELVASYRAELEKAGTPDAGTLVEKFRKMLASTRKAVVEKKR